MEKAVPWLAWILWILFVFAVLAPFTPVYVNGFLTAGGTVLLAKLTSRYRAYGWKGMVTKNGAKDAEDPVRKQNAK
jgi:hypothetical protein